MGPVPRGDAEDNRRNPPLKKRDRRTLPTKHMRQSFKEQTPSVSSTGSVLIFCHKQLSLKLHFKAGSNNLVGSRVL